MQRVFLIIILFPKRIIAIGIIQTLFVFVVKYSSLLFCFCLLFVYRVIKSLFYLQIAFESVFYFVFFYVYPTVIKLYFSTIFPKTRFCFLNQKFMLVQRTFNVAYIIYISITLVMQLQLSMTKTLKITASIIIGFC